MLAGVDVSDLSAPLTRKCRWRPRRNLTSVGVANVYIDGFNLYYGCLKGTPYKWLDLDALCRRLLPKHEIQRIRYFTALVSARPGDPQQPIRQEIYLRALRTIPHLSIHLGRFLVLQSQPSALLLVVDASGGGLMTAAPHRPGEGEHRLDW